MNDRQKELLAETLRLQKEVERISLQNQLTITQSVADELDELIEEAYSSDSIHVWSDYFDYYEYIKQEINKEDELYKFMYPKNRLLGTANRNKVILYLTQLDLVKVVEG